MLFTINSISECPFSAWVLRVAKLWNSFTDSWVKPTGTVQFDTGEFTTKNLKVEVFTGLPSRVKKNLKTAWGGVWTTLHHRVEELLFPRVPKRGVCSPTPFRDYSLLFTGDRPRHSSLAATPEASGCSAAESETTGQESPPERNLQSYSEDRALQPRKPFMAACPQNNRHTQFFPIHLTVTPSGTRTPTLLSRIPHSRLGVARAEDATADRHTDPSEPRLYLARPHPAPRSPPQELQDRAEKRGLTPRETSAAALTPPSPAKRESSIPPPEKTCWDQKPKTQAREPVGSYCFLSLRLASPLVK